MNDLLLHQREPCVHTLGPGERYCLWVQGCGRKCPGCTSPASQEMEGGYRMSAGALAMEIALSEATGLTISGGEPFLQAQALANMLHILRHDHGRDVGVIVYTGFCLEELESVPGAQALLAQTDLLIDGPYIRELDDGKSLRGSSNQRVWPLTPRYNKPEILSLYGAEGREVEYFLHASGMNCVGVANHLSQRFNPYNPPGASGHT